MTFCGQTVPNGPTRQASGKPSRRTGPSGFTVSTSAEMEQGETERLGNTASFAISHGTILRETLWTALTSRP
jgi:hypothetical protein